MNKQEAMIELLRIAATTVSPTVHDRATEVAHIAKQWYKECIDDTSVEPEGQKQEIAMRRGRPPRTVI